MLTINSFPIYERKSKAFLNLVNVNKLEFDKNYDRLNRAEKNLFINQASEFLQLYERDLGIEYQPNLSLQQRREQVISRYRAAFSQTTIETIKNVASAYSNGDVEVNSTSVKGVYEIKFVGTKGVPDNLNGLKASLQVIIPAHLELIYTFTFTPWKEVQHLRWKEVLNKTWSRLKIWEGEAEI